MNRLIHMIINQVVRHLIRRGVGGRPQSKGSDANFVTLNAQALGRKARQAANLARRLGR